MDETPGGIAQMKHGRLGPTARRTGMGGLLGLMMASAAGVAGAAIGDLDPTFGDHGRVSLSQFVSFRALAEGPDHKLYFTYGASSALIGRLNADGSLDPGFAGPEIANLDFPGGEHLNVRRAVVTSGGNLILAGAVTGPSASPQSAVARLNPDGSRDEGFGVGGLARVDLPTVSKHGATDLVLLPDDGLLLGGYSEDGDVRTFMLIRLQPGGQLDTTFGDGGAKIISEAANIQGAARLYRQPDGKFVVCDFRPSSHGTLVMRLDASGGLEPGFGVGGLAESVVDRGSCLLRSDGRILVHGTRNSGQYAAVGQLKSDGTIDGSFGGGDGVLDLALDCSPSRPCDDAWNPEYVTDAIELDDGSTLLAAVRGRSTMLALARLRPDGTLDPDFGRGGVSDLDLGDHGYYSGAYAGRLFEDGAQKLRVAGIGSGNSSLARIHLADAPGASVVGLGLGRRTPLEDQGSVQISVRRTGSAEGAVSVDYATEDREALAGSDYQAVSGTLTWADGDMEPKTVTVPLLDDAAKEGAESFALYLSNPMNSGLAQDRDYLTIQASDAAQSGTGSGGGNGGGGVGGSGGGGGGAVESAWIAWATLLLLLGSRRRPPARP